jgi:AcrR family transcriptional regulator
MTQLTPSKRWSPLRDQQRAAVVNAVLAMVSRGDAVTVADLADLAGMSRPTFYKYFPTLGAALLHTHKVVLQEMETHLARTMPDSTVPALERLLFVFDTSFEYTRSHLDVLRFFSFFDFTFRRFGLSKEEHEELARIVQDSGDPTRDLFVEGQAEGSIDPRLPVEATVMAMSGSILGLSQRLLIQDEYSDNDDDRARAAHERLIEAWRDHLRP